MVKVKNIRTEVESIFSDELWNQMKESGRSVFYKVIEQVKLTPSKTFKPPELAKVIKQSKDKNQNQPTDDR